MLKAVAAIVFWICFSFQGNPTTNIDEEMDQVNYFNNFNKFSLNQEKTVAIDIHQKTYTSCQA